LRRLEQMHNDTDKAITEFSRRHEEEVRLLTEIKTLLEHQNRG